MKEKSLKNLEERFEQLEKRAEQLEIYVKKINKIITDIDKTYLHDVSKMYGFNEKNMFYIGVASGKIYKKPINEKIMNMISNIHKLEWQDIVKINQYFMKP